MPMMFLLTFVGLSSLAAIADWRVGLFLCVAAGCLQDPIRKVAVGTPAYLTLAFFPIYAAIFFNLWRASAPTSLLRRVHPTLFRPLGLLAAALAASTVQTILSHGMGSILIASLGAFSYLGGIPALLMGFCFLRRRTVEMDTLVSSSALLTSVMLSGVPLEHAGFRFEDPWLGTIAQSSQEWRRWYNGTEWVNMISGFYRSPEIMGWHAAAACCASIYLIARRPNQFALWSLTAVWSVFCVILSGRRKMLLIVLVFITVFLYLCRQKRSRVVAYLAFAAAAGIPLLLYFSDEAYVDAAGSGFAASGGRFSVQLVEGPLWLLTIVGPFGYGVGTKTQGAQHLDATVESPLVEGGFEKILVELGICGALAMAAAGVGMFRCAVRSLRVSKDFGNDQLTFAAAGAFLVSNIAAFSTAFQVFGDPFIVCIIGFVAGVLLSASRLAGDDGAHIGPARMSIGADRS